MKPLIPILTLLVAASSVAELKDDRSLYDLAPEDAAFVRLVNASEFNVKVDFGDKTLEALPGCRTSEIDWIYPRVALPGGKESVAGKLYTYVVKEDSSEWIETKLETNPLKATLGLINLAKKQPVSLVTTTGKRPVFADIAPTQSAYRFLNPISVELSVHSASETLDMRQINLKRGKTIEAFICDTDDSLDYTLSTY